MNTQRVPRSDFERDKLRKLVWKHTHKDYRGTTDGVRYVLHRTTSVPLDSLTNRQLLDKLPDAIREEHYGPIPKTDAEIVVFANELALELGHTPLKQRTSFECPRCGMSGTVQIQYTGARAIKIGAIFTDRCTG